MIKVKKLVWETIQIQVKDIKNSLHLQYRLEYHNNYEFGYIKPLEKGFIAFRVDDVVAVFDTLEQAQEHIRQLWNEYVLCLVEE